MTGTMTSADDRPEEWSAGDDDDGSMAPNHSALRNGVPLPMDLQYHYTSRLYVLCCSIRFLFYILIFRGYPLLLCVAFSAGLGTLVKRCAWVMRNMRGVVDRIGSRDRDRDLHCHGPKWFRLKGLVLCLVLFHFGALFAQRDVRLLLTLASGFMLCILFYFFFFDCRKIDLADRSVHLIDLPSSSSSLGPLVPSASQSPSPRHFCCCARWTSVDLVWR